MAAKIRQRTVPRIKRNGGLDVAMRDYQAAMVNNLTASWKGSHSTAAQVVFKDLMMLRSRSREQVQNNDYAKFFTTLLKTNVVGANGFDFQAHVRDEDGTVDEFANRALLTSFRDWMKPKHCDLRSQQSFASLQRQFIANVAQDGEILCRMYRGNQYGKYGFKIKFIDPGYLDVNYNHANAGNGNYVEMSIEYDSNDIPVAYHIVKPTRDEGQSMLLGYGQTGVRERVPAEDILHCYVADLIDQPRGLPWMATPLLRMNMQGGFEEAALVNARAGAGKMGFFEQEPDLKNIFDTDMDTGEIIDESDPGTWHGLPPGVKVSEYDPTYPNNEFGAFTKAILRGIAAGLGVAYHTLANDLEGVNYSSGRLGSQNERDVWIMLQDWMKDCFLYPVYEAWLSQQLTRGTIQINGRPLRASQEEKYQMVEFQGRRWSGVDPKKEADANQIDFQMRTKSLSGIIREKGQDPDQVWKEIAEDETKLEALGIKSTPPPAPGAAGAEAEDEDEDAAPDSGNEA